MGAKSSYGIIGSLIVVAAFGYFKFNSWQQSERRHEIFRNATETTHLFDASTNRTVTSDTMAVEKAHMDAVVEAGRRGDMVGMLTLCTNIPTGVSAAYRKGLDGQSGKLRNFIAFFNEIDSRSGAEGLDLDAMLSPRFLCGLDGFDASLKRIDVAIRFMDEMEAKIKKFREEKDGPIPRAANKRDPFNLAPQWDRAMSTMTSSFTVMRRMAYSVKKLVRLHRDNPDKWKWEDGEVVYYDADLCDNVNSIRDEIAGLSEQYMRLQNSFTETRHETFDKIGNAVNKAASRH